MTPAPNGTEERRQDYLKYVMDCQNRITILETYREADKELTERHILAITNLTNEINTMKLSVNTIRTERNTLVAVASIFGAMVTWIAKGVFAFMVSAR